LAAYKFYTDVMSDIVNC